MTTRYQITDDFSLLELANRNKLGCAGLSQASVQVVLSNGAAYSNAVLTVKGTLDGTTWFDLGEPTISADALRGPFNVKGLFAICVEVSTVSSADRRARVVWSAVECCG